MIEKTAATLAQYLPEGTSTIIAKWIHQAPCLFKISKTRSTKFGDYRAPFQGKGHRISINHSLNPFAFLITTVHEFAHLKTWNENGNKVKPHGTEWKNNFKLLMNAFFELKIFPLDIHQAISQYLTNPGASSCSDLVLYRTLQGYDRPKAGYLRVEELPVGEHFAMTNGRIFKKGKQMRKRFRCMEIPSGRIFLFSPVAEVKRIL